MTTFLQPALFEKDKKLLTGNYQLKPAEKQPVNHHHFNCKKTIFNDADADALFSIFKADIIDRKIVFKGNL